MKRLIPAMAALALLLLPSCRTTISDVNPESCYTPQECAYLAIDDLISQHDFKCDIGRLLVATLVDINNVNETSMFGRQMAEYLSARLTQLDHDVIHATVRQDHLLVRDEGQFLITRNISNLAADFNARTVLVGTYGVTKEFVYVSLKLVSTVDDSTLAATDFTLRREGSVAQMLTSYSRTW
jgi:uncharacterized membrane-anchored protein